MIEIEEIINIEKEPYEIFIHLITWLNEVAKSPWWEDKRKKIEDIRKEFKCNGRTISSLYETPIKEAINWYFKGSDYYEGIDTDTKLNEWYDYAIKSIKSITRIIYELNIKVSEGDAPDNLSSMAGVCKALTGNIGPNKFPCTKTKEDLKYILKNLKTGSDYYLIYYDKKNNEFWWSSLKRLIVVVPNPSNKPFQIKPNDNRYWSEIGEKGEVEAMKYLLEILQKSFKNDIDDELNTLFEIAFEKINTTGKI
ncbi:hypothetical protein AGMMS49944_24950 [Spirochaetia bacterium]|nr:hypothetical protein AGMMS49944_24950 [Spirochaetia bacterium]